jgi:hypothetical protein
MEIGRDMAPDSQHAGLFDKLSQLAGEFQLSTK